VLFQFCLCAELACVRRILRCVPSAHSKKAGPFAGSGFSRIGQPFAGLDQNAGTTAPLYFSSMKRFTSGEFSAAISFLKAGEFLLSSRATSKLA
jgi:hypothetical protein